MDDKPADTIEHRFMTLWQGAGFDPSKKNECAATAGWTPDMKVARRNPIQRKLAQNERMRKILKKKNLTMEKAADKLAELIEAKHPFAPSQPDNLARHKAVDTLLKLHDAYPATKIDIDKHERKEIVVTGEVIQRLERYNDQRRVIEQGETFDVIPESATD